MPRLIKGEKARLRAEEKKVSDWNARYPIGTLVNLTLDFDAGILPTKTRSMAQMLCGSAVIWVDGVSSCYDIDFISIR
jgi:hypothetical protein